MRCGSSRRDQRRLPRSGHRRRIRAILSAWATGIGRAREAFNQQAWRRAYDELSAAYLAGLSGESRSAWISAHEKCAHVGDVARAVRCAFWLVFALLNAGDVARGGGWVDRAQRLLDDRKIDCVERGYLRYAAALRAAFSGDVRTGHEGFHAAAEIGVLFHDLELAALARIGEGRCLIGLDPVDEGVALLDEGMVAIEANEVSAIAIGDAYCTVIEGWTELFDVRRAHTWTAALRVSRALQRLSTLGEGRQESREQVAEGSRVGAPGRHVGEQFVAEQQGRLVGVTDTTDGCINAV